MFSSFNLMDVYVLCCRCLLDLRGGPFFFKIPLQAELTAVSSYYGAMVPPTCLGYRLERWPILTYCPFKVTPSYLGNFYPTVAKSKGAAIWHSVTPQLMIQGTILSSSLACSPLAQNYFSTSSSSQNKKTALKLAKGVNECEWLSVLLC